MKLSLQYVHNLDSLVNALMNMEWIGEMTLALATPNPNPQTPNPNPQTPNPKAGVQG